MENKLLIEVQVVGQAKKIQGYENDKKTLWGKMAIPKND